MTDKELRAELLGDPSSLKVRIRRNRNVEVFTTKPRGDGGRVPWWMLAGDAEELKIQMEIERGL